MAPAVHRRSQRQLREAARSSSSRAMEEIMSSQTLSANAFSVGESETHFRGWVIFAGITSLVLGIAAVTYDVTATTASVVLFGSLLIFAGVMQSLHAFQV